MPRINNVDFLTLPQQVSKNKKDIESLNNNVGSIQTEIDKIVVGDLVIQILNPNTPIVIENYGVNTIPTGVQSALLEYIKNSMTLIDKKEPLYVNLKVMGDIVPDVDDTTDYTVIFTTTNNVKLHINDYLFRAVGYSQNVRFEIYAEYEYAYGEIRYNSAPEIIMVSTISNSVFYTQPDKIVGGVVAKSELLPNSTLIPPQKGDMVIAGSGIYTIDSIVGTNVNLVTQTGFVAPTGVITNRILTNTSNTPNETTKRRINVITGLKLFNVNDDNINGISMEEQITALGLEFRVGAYITYEAIGSDSAPTYVSRLGGLLAFGFVNNSGSPVVISGITSMGYSDLNRTIGVSEQNAVDENVSNNPINIDYSKTSIFKRSYMNTIIHLLNGKTIANNTQFGVLIKF